MHAAAATLLPVDPSVPQAGQARLSDVAVVAIGRNEGERLVRCLGSVLGDAALVVYVDSGSTDGSVDAARAIGARVVELDAGQPFTAARARNAGFAAVLADGRNIAFVQFVDGDCEVAPGWLASARETLIARPRLAAVFGRRRERFPERSIYNRLCDEEWNVPPGEVRYCGGDVLMRVGALRTVGGYRGDLIAGEEPELCVRLRRADWRLACLPLAMTVHDAAMLHFSQWWRRAMRSGHAFAEGAHLHGAGPERHWVAETRRVWLWGLGLPIGVLVATLALGWPGLLAALVYPAQVARLTFRARRTSAVALWSALFLVLANFPEVLGQLRFHLNRIGGRAGGIIEYK